MNINFFQSRFSAQRNIPLMRSAWSAVQVPRQTGQSGPKRSTVVHGRIGARAVHTDTELIFVDVFS